MSSTSVSGLVSHPYQCRRWSQLQAHDTPRWHQFLPSQSGCQPPSGWRPSERSSQTSFRSASLQSPEGKKKDKKHTGLNKTNMCGDIKTLNLHMILKLVFKCQELTLGHLSSQGIPAMTSTASAPPTPIQMDPRPPPLGVWESVPISITPG